MAKQLRLNKENSEDIGFVYECLVSGAIALSECKEWVYHAIELEDEVPSYMFDILDVEHKFDFKPLQVIGYVPSWKRSDNEANAIDGIAYKRHSDYQSDAVSRDEALKALTDSPHIEQRFRETFPFIDY